MTLRVAMLIHDYYPLVGGAQTLLRSQAPRLMKLGVEVHILTRQTAGTAALEQLDDIWVHRFPVSGSKLLSSLSFTLLALNCLRQLRPTIIHANEFISPATVALLAKRSLGTPIVVTPHRSGELGDIVRLQNRLGGKFRLNALKNNANAIVVISQEIEQELLNTGFSVDKLHNIRNSVDSQRFYPLNPVEKKTLRQALMLPTESVIVIFTGRLVREKRLHHLLSIWPAVRSACPNVELLLIGEGDQESLLRGLSSPGVHFLGAKNDVRPYLQAADVFVLPSAAEGLSIAMLEGMSCGLAPLITQVGGATEVIFDGVNGLLIPADDLSALQTRLIELVVNTEQREAIGMAARQRIECEFSVQASVEKLHRLYSNLATTG